MINEIRLLTKEEMFGTQKLDILKRTGVIAGVTDYAILNGAFVSRKNHVDNDSTLKGRTSWGYLMSLNGNGHVSIVDDNSSLYWATAGRRDGAIRPVLSISDLSCFIPYIKISDKGIPMLEFGEQPQYAVGATFNRQLEEQYRAGTLIKTGKTYTNDSKKGNLEKFEPHEDEEYEYEGKKYVRVTSNSNPKENYRLSNGVRAVPGMNIWLEVAPIKWYVDKEHQLLISQTYLRSGVRFCDDRKYNGVFKNTDMYMFLNNYLLKDMIPSVIEHQSIENSPKLR